MTEDEKMDKVYEFIAPAMREAMDKLLIVNSDSAFAATICTMIAEYCDKTGTSVKRMSGAINSALIHYEEDEE